MRLQRTLVVALAALLLAAGPGAALPGPAGDAPENGASPKTHDCSEQQVRSVQAGTCERDGDPGPEAAYLDAEAGPVDSRTRVARPSDGGSTETLLDGRGDARSGPAGDAGADVWTECTDVDGDGACDIVDVDLVLLTGDGPAGTNLVGVSVFCYGTDAGRRDCTEDTTISVSLFSQPAGGAEHVSAGVDEGPDLDLCAQGTLADVGCLD